jgi:hypothetical protein
MKEGSTEKMRSAINRARRDLSGTTIGIVGTGIEANPFQKYSNPDLRYLTFFLPEI